MSRVPWTRSPDLFFSFPISCLWEYGTIGRNGQDLKRFYRWCNRPFSNAALVVPARKSAEEMASRWLQEVHAELLADGLGPLAIGISGGRGVDLAEHFLPTRGEKDDQR